MPHTVVICNVVWMSYCYCGSWPQIQLVLVYDTRNYDYWTLSFYWAISVNSCKSITQQKCHHTRNYVEGSEIFHSAFFQTFQNSFKNYRCQVIRKLLRNFFPIVKSNYDYASSCKTDFPQIALNLPSQLSLWKVTLRTVHLSCQKVCASKCPSLTWGKMCFLTWCSLCYHCQHRKQINKEQCCSHPDRAQRRDRQNYSVLWEK